MVKSEDTLTHCNDKMSRCNLQSEDKVSGSGFQGLPNPKWPNIIRDNNYFDYFQFIIQKLLLNF